MKKKILGLLLFCSINFCFAQSGSLDPTFGTNGIVNTDLGSFYNYNSFASQVLVKPDGSIYIVLFGFGETLISKRFPNGSIDSSYGINGYSRSVPLTEVQAALKPDGKMILLGCQLNSFSYFEFFVARLNLNGTIDSSFGVDGMQTVPITGSSLTIQPDGKIVVAGTSADEEDNTYFAVVRYNADGGIDSTFNGNGQAITDFEFKIPGERGEEDSIEIHSAKGFTVAIQADGKIVVGGYVYTGLDNDFAIARYKSNGSPDSTFDVDGKQTTNLDDFDDIGRSLALQTNGKIILAGYTSDGNTNYFGVVRYNINGSLDFTFDGDGIQTANLASDMQIGNSAAIQSDGKIVVAGYTQNGADSDFGVARFNANGSPDNTFDNDGILTTDINASDDFAGSVAIQSDGRMVVAGYAVTAGVSAFVLTRYNANGSLDNSFDNDGKLVGSYKQGYTNFNSIAIQADKKIIAAGQTWNGSNYDFSLARYNANGSLDSTFSNDGKQITDFGASEEAVSAAIQSDGKIVVAGNTGTQFAIARYTVNGILDNSFSGDGKQIIPMGFADVCKSVALQSDGKILIAGYTFTDTNYDSAYFATTRLNSNGTPDNTFSNDGKQLTDFESSPSFGASVVIQSNGKIVVTGRSYINGQNNFSLVRYNADGSPDNTFSGDGKQNNIFGPDGYYAQSLLLQDDGKIVVAGSSEEISNGRSSFALARYKTNGDLDSSFNDDGFQSAYLGAHFNFGLAVALNKDGRIAVGGTNDNYAIVLYKKDGNSDSAFGRNGVQISAIGAGNSSIQSIAFLDNKLYAAGYGQYPGNFGVVARYLVGAEEPSSSPFITKTNGKWNEPGTWIGGVVPSETSAVTVKHNVVVDANSKCYSLKVEAPGGNVLISTGANLTITH